MVRLGATLALSAALAIVAAGCGGEASAEEKWAGDICSAVGGWQDQVEQSSNDAKDELQSPDAGTRAAIETDVRDVVDATDKLGDNLRGLEPPDTEAGQQAKGELDKFAVQLEATATTMKETVDKLPEDAGIVEVVRSLGPLVPSIQSLAGNASSAFAAVKESGGALKDGFESADSCKRYR